jgi:hypothetical protein
LNKVITAQKTPINLPLKDVNKAYGSSAGTIIHPPKNFNIPEMVIHVFHFEKQSSLGEEDAMIVYLWLETPQGHAYVPVALIGDNPSAHDFWKAQLAGSPAENNVIVVKNDEFQIRIHGNTLFAGWTVPIKLLPNCSLPPSCLLIEGYGEPKPITYTRCSISGYKTIWELNVLGAFATFFHPSSKYSGPGTEGFFARDLASTSHPPTSK